MPTVGQIYMVYNTGKGSILVMDFEISRGISDMVYQGYPWQMGPDAHYKTEQQWRDNNPPQHIVIPKMAQMIRTMPADEWRETVSNLTQTAQSGFIPAWDAHDPQILLINAVVNDGTREGVAKVLEASVAGMVDSDDMEYLRVENPAGLQSPPEAGQTPDLGSIIRLRVALQIWEPTVSSNRLDEMDLTAKEVEQLATSNRKAFERLAQVLVGKWCASLEEDLVEQHDRTPLDQEKKILIDMSNASATKIEVTAKPLGVGDNAHILRMYRSKLPFQPETCQGSARFRRGRAALCS